jgi:outer membrane murein-binding lipoprotein Lpp
MRLDLHGTLSGEWVPLVEQHWRSILNGQGVSPKVTVVLADVDFIDADGVRLLRRMADRGAEFVVSGCMNRYVIDTLQQDVRAIEGVEMMATQTTTPGIDLKAYEDKIVAKIREVSARIDQIETTTKAKRAQAEIAAITGLKTAREGIETKLNELRTTQATQVARAKTEIDAAVVKLEKALEDFREKYTTPAGKEH